MALNSYSNNAHAFAQAGYELEDDSVPVSNSDVSQVELQENASLDEASFGTSSPHSSSKSIPTIPDVSSVASTQIIVPTLSSGSPIADPPIAVRVMLPSAKKRKYSIQDVDMEHKYDSHTHDHDVQPSSSADVAVVLSHRVRAGALYLTVVHGTDTLDRTTEVSLDRLRRSAVVQQYMRNHARIRHYL
jgi:hypothetical protein